MSIIFRIVGDGGVRANNRCGRIAEPDLTLASLMPRSRLHTRDLQNYRRLIIGIYDEANNREGWSIGPRYR
jgi:hypothetical protein